MGVARYPLHSVISLDALSLSSAVRSTRRSRLRRLFASMPLVALAWGGLNFARAQVTPVVTWTQQNPATSPSARANSQMAYDASSGQVVLFSGETSGVSPNDTWTWNGTNWTQQSPVASPPVHVNGSMGYDAANGQVVLFGGVGIGGFLDDTWTWDGTNWTQQSPATSPSARALAPMAYDAASGQMVLFGGINELTGNLNDTWTWNGTDWTQLFPATSPPAASGASMAYDAASRQLILFGGLDNSGNYLNDTWTWDGTNWTQQNPATSPSARANSQMAYDAASGQVVLFGGAGNSGPQNDTWTWDGTNWTQQSTTKSPSKRLFASMAYDAASGQVVLFGGVDQNQNYLNDTWTLVTPDFVLTVTPTTTTVSRPGNEPVVLELMPVNGFKGPVKLNCILPAGVASGTKCAGLPDTVTLNGTSTVSYSTGVLFPNTTNAGTYVVTFTAVDGNFNDSTEATFNVNIK